MKTFFYVFIIVAAGVIGAGCDPGPEQSPQIETKGAQPPGEGVEGDAPKIQVPN
jgi:hypothetical protein